MAEVVQLAEVRARRARVGLGRLVSKKEVAARLGVTPRTIERYMRDRGLPFLKPFAAGSVWFRVEEVDAWLDRM